MASLLASPQIKKNPDLYVFLPLLYTVWSDTVLTPSEVATLEGLIRSQTWLSDEDRSLLLSQIDPTDPPAPDDFMQWREEIRRVASDPRPKQSLVDLGIALAALHDDG
ncbi:MAG: hypothetical protein ACK50M_07380, partial [Cyclobacteriaceae bacterium]